MFAVELPAFWTAVGAWGLAFAATAAGTVLGRPAWNRLGRGLAAAAVLAQGAALVGRGLTAWSPPFTTYYESVLGGTWLAGAAALLATRRRPELAGILLVTAPVALLLLGSSVFTVREFAPLGPALQSWWLVVHVVFALLAFAAALTAAGAGAVLVVRPSREGAGIVVSRGIALAFLFQLVMIASGAIWAHQAWGRYWGWDPIETCSLLTLLVFGLGRHLERLHGWGGRRLAGVAVAGFLVTAYGIWGVPFFQPSVHLYQGPRGPGGP